MNEELEPIKTPDETVPRPTAESEVADVVESPLPEPEIVPEGEDVQAAADTEFPPAVEDTGSPQAEDVKPDSETGKKEPTVNEVAKTPAEPENKKKWYVVKVQSGREDSIKNNLERRVKIENLEQYVGRILIPIEKVTEVRNQKRIEKKRKKFPGYLMCEVELNDDVKVLFRESSGVGEFVGGRIDKDPAPMSDREVERMLMDTDTVGEGGKEGGKKPKDEEQKTKKIVLNFAVGDRVKVLQGMFKDSEGEVKEIPPNPAENSKVKVIVQFWGKPVDFEVDYWQVERV
jgi:transcriptional antiterminator NusG